MVGAIALSLSLSLTGCGGGSSGGTTSAATPATPAAATTPAGVADFTTLDLNALANYTNPVLPVYYDATVAVLDNTPANNAISDRVATLGRVLFYDKRLSINDTVSCASCHQQASGFDDPRRFSTGFSGAAFTTVHAMRLGNVRYYQPGSMFWNKRVASLELQASEPIINAIEMGFVPAIGGITALITKMQSSTYYPDLFNFAFGDPAITETRIQQALAQFQRAMISSSSRWDAAYAQVFNPAAPNRALGVPLPGFSVQEDRGRQLFVAPVVADGAGCAACHLPPTFALTANSLSNGLDAGETVIFKSPSLKSVGLSRAFMHDGRFATLDAVVEHYNSGIQAGPALDNRLRAPGGAPQRLNLSVADKAALVAFMQTFTDTVLMADPKFSDPFKK